MPSSKTALKKTSKKAAGQAPVRAPSTRTLTARQSAVQVHSRVRSILDAARNTIARTVNSAQVVANWLIGREIVEQEQLGKDRAGYGQELLLSLADRLQADYGSGYGVDNLELFRRFYLTYPHLLPSNTLPPNSDAVRRKSTLSAKASPISDAVRRKSAALSALVHIRGQASLKEGWQPGALSPQLSWTHYRRLTRIERESERNFYEIEATQQAWSARELERQVASLLFDRLAKSRDKKGVIKLATQGQEIASVFDTLKDPVVLEFLNLPVSHRLAETDLETALINNLQAFLLELGKGFAFVSRQERITLDGDHFYVDLVFYHVVLKCYVLIDLKVGKLNHGDLGQTQLYVNYFDQERRCAGDHPTVGLILCSDKNDAVVKYTLGEQQKRNIFTSRYQLHLPTVEELRNEIRREVRALTKPSAKPSVNPTTKTAPTLKKPVSKTRRKS
jgi:predicted nuclease of restriction endonuclease-like (RecB) superfamily